MTEPAAQPDPAPAPTAELMVAPSPHVSNPALKTRRMMLDVLIALVPVLIASVVVFRQYAIVQLVICVASCIAAEGLFTLMRRKPLKLLDGSAIVTGVILALSLPAMAYSKPYVGVIGSFVAIGIGKVIFGGLGQNLFNPAMVGRAFVMICFAGAIGASGYVDADRLTQLDILTQATPMNAKKAQDKAATERAEEGDTATTLPGRGGPDTALLKRLILGNTNGSLGETSALACLLGLLYLAWRKTASWQIPAGVLLAVAVIAGISNAMNPNASFTVLHHLSGGALLFGAVYIATDPVTSPLTHRGKWIFGAGIGALVMLIRSLSGYPEGLMFAVLLMNAVVPLINRWTIPTPVGGPVPEKT